jgi:RNA polymerase sigma factor (sigma-70 family)
VSPAADEATLAAEFAALRPELHRYCARLVGSVLDGEDVVQDAFARALVAWRARDAAPTALRPWLFRIAHNRALDLLRARAVRAGESMDAAEDLADPGAEGADEALMRREAVDAAVFRFTALPVTQRGVVILKDVLDQSLREIADLLDLTVDAVKAHLARGRARLKAAPTRSPATPGAVSSQAVRYAALFNARDWEALRALLVDDVRLEQSTFAPRTGAADVGMFFGTYARLEPVFLAPAWLDGREVLAVFEAEDAAAPAYVMRLDWRDGKIAFIRDYRYVRYMMEAARVEVER